MLLNRFHKTLIASAIVSVATLASASAFANNTTEDAAKKGLEIATEADRRDSGFGDLSNNLTMTLSNKYGEKSIRSMRTKTLEQSDDGDKSLVVFDNPRDVKGTAFLSFTHKVGADDQWLYLPALKRVKRISSSNKSGPFMGSEFSYEDIASQEVEKYTYKYLRNETLDGRDHFVLELDPVDPKSGYSVQHVWIDTKEYRPWKTDYYDRKGDLMKTLMVSDYNLYGEKYWRANTMEMVNHQTGKSTILSYTDWVFGNGFSDRDFSKNSLLRAK